MTTFGVELATHLLDTNTGIPPIVAKCICEVEARGIDMRVRILFFFTDLIDTKSD